MADDHEIDPGLPSRVTYLERAFAALDKDVSQLRTLQTMQHTENLGRFSDVEEISNKNSEKLDTLLTRASYADGKLAGTVMLWKTVAAAMGIMAVLIPLGAWLWPHPFHTGQ
jgi:hypothetical protein